VIYPGSTPVGSATLVVANVLTCNKYSPKYWALLGCMRLALLWVLSTTLGVDIIDHNGSLEGSMCSALDLWATVRCMSAVAYGCRGDIVSSSDLQILWSHVVRLYKTPACTAVQEVGWPARAH
jgi:hypothetical protein